MNQVTVKETKAFQKCKDPIKCDLVLKTKSLKEIEDGVQQVNRIGADKYLSITNHTQFQRNIVLELCK